METSFIYFVLASLSDGVSFSMLFNVCCNLPSCLEPSLLADKRGCVILYIKLDSFDVL